MREARFAVSFLAAVVLAASLCAPVSAEPETMLQWAQQVVKPCAGGTPVYAPDFVGKARADLLAPFKNLKPGRNGIRAVFQASDVDFGTLALLLPSQDRNSWALAMTNASTPVEGFDIPRGQVASTTVAGLRLGMSASDAVKLIPHDATPARGCGYVTYRYRDLRPGDAGCPNEVDVETGDTVVAFYAWYLFSPHPGC